jgi:hypothetical protein
VHQSAAPDEYYCASEDLYVDFSVPVHDLSLVAWDVRTVGTFAAVRVYSAGSLLGTVHPSGTGDEEQPIAIDLSAYTGVTRLEFENTTEDGDAILWDDVDFAE